MDLKLAPALRLERLFGERETNPLLENVLQGGRRNKETNGQRVVDKRMEDALIKSQQGVPKTFGMLKALERLCDGLLGGVIGVRRDFRLPSL